MIEKCCVWMMVDLRVVSLGEIEGEVEALWLGGGWCREVETKWGVASCLEQGGERSGGRAGSSVGSSTLDYRPTLRGRRGGCG